MSVLVCGHCLSFENHSLTHTWTERVRAYAYIDLNAMSSPYLRCGTMLCCAVLCSEFWQTIQMSETVQLMPSVCHLSLYLYSDWYLSLISNWTYLFDVWKKKHCTMVLNIPPNLTTQKNDSNLRIYTPILLTHTGRYVHTRKIVWKSTKRNRMSTPTSWCIVLFKNMCIVHSLATTLCIVHVSVCFKIYTQTTYLLCRFVSFTYSVWCYELIEITIYNNIRTTSAEAAAAMMAVTATAKQTPIHRLMHKYSIHWE